MEAQKYVIYINDNPLFIQNRTEASHLEQKSAEKQLVFHYQGKKKALLNFVDFLEKNEKPASVTLLTNDVPKLWHDIQTFYKKIDAAGGYVENKEGNVLAMFRRGAWDLPKGKIDEGETPEQAAVREVEEETGVKDVVLGDFLCCTYHTYPHKGKRVLKRTFWYKMKTLQEELIPQIEEDIELLEWLPCSDLLEKTDFYESLKQVLHHSK